MESVAKYKNANASAQKLRLLADEIKGMSVEKASDFLLFHRRQKMALILRKTLMSAVSNAENNHNMDIDDLVVSRIWIDKGMVLKRWAARAKGRGSRILKRYSHVLIAVSEASES